MKSYFKIIILFVFAIVITVLISPLIAAILPFHPYKIMSRIVVITIFLLFFYYRRSFGFQSAKLLGFELNKRWWMLTLLGFVLGVITIGVISLIMLGGSIRIVAPDACSINWLKYVIEYLFAGFAVAFFEEFIFRGFILQSILKDSGKVSALLITNIIYSIVHFLRPDTVGITGKIGLVDSIKAVPLFFSPIFVKFFEIWPSLVGLFLVGIVLSVAYLRVRTLALAIGLHAGWVLSMKLLTLSTDTVIKGTLWLDGGVTANPITWIVLMIFIVILLGCPRYESSKTAQKI